MSIADVPRWDPSRVAGANVIGICGWPGSGRATVATVVKKYHLPVRRHITWRKALKKLATMVTGIPVYEWWTSDHGRMQLPVQLEEARVRAEIQLYSSRLIPGGESAPFVESTTATLMAEPELTRGRLLQLLEECFRGLDAFWTSEMDKDHHRDGYTHDIVISDIATEAGATYVKQHGVLIEIQQPGALGSQLRPHIVIQNDGTLKQLWVAVDIALRLERAGLDPDRPMRITASAISEPTLACYRGTVYPPP